VRWVPAPNTDREWLRLSSRALECEISDHSAVVKASRPPSRPVEHKLRIFPAGWQ